MDARQHMYYALGILAYAMALADGKVQDEERKKVFELIKEETSHNIDFLYAEIIFQLLEKDHQGFEGVYRWAITELEKSRHYLSDEIKATMMNVLRKIAEAFSPVTAEEMKILTRFEADLNRIKVDHII